MSNTDAAVAPGNRATARTHNIKRSVSLYSFQEEYYLRKMTLEEIIATCARLDIPGIEIIGDQMIRGYPNIPDAFIEQWHGWMEKYGRTPVCLDQFIDWNKYRGRLMTEDERVAVLVQDIKNAAKLGCSVIRVIHDTSAAVMEKAAPYAEEYNVRLGNEIHAPSHLDDAFSQSLVEMFERTGSKHVGFVIDFGLYTRRLPRVVSDRWLRDGMRPDIAQFIIDAYNRHEGLETLADDIDRMGGTENDIAMMRMGTHNIYVDPRRMLDLMPYIFHFHAKFNEMLPDYTEYSIPYDEVVPVLIEGGYNGYLSSEYEGNRHIQDAFEVDSVEQVRRHQVMLRRLLGEE
jgi:sugar phosphate isomerase/epimerase